MTEPVTIDIEPGEIVSFKKGMVLKSKLTGKTYLVKRAKYLGEGKWLSLEKEDQWEVDAQ